MKNLASDAILMYFYTKASAMIRQSISFTEPNDAWLKEQINQKEYSSKSELVNDLIRQARQQQVQIDWIRTKLERAEKSGFAVETKEQIKQQAISKLNEGLHSQ